MQFADGFEGDAAPARRHIQEDGRIRHRGAAVDAREGKARILRVFTLAGGVTIHNAFLDRKFWKVAQCSFAIIRKRTVSPSN